jgi:hypothetical protein
MGPRESEKYEVCVFPHLLMIWITNGYRHLTNSHLNQTITYHILKIKLYAAHKRLTLDIRGNLNVKE